MKEAYDAVVVGSGTAGIFFARKLAERGYGVLVVDSNSEEKLGERLDVFHIDKAYFSKYGVPEPKEGDEDYLTLFEYVVVKSALDNYPKRTNYPFNVMRLPFFLKRLRKWAIEAGVDFSYETSFKELTYGADGRINGIIAEKDGKHYNISARLVADCSGIPSVVRRTLKACTVETFEIGPKDKFYVVIRYAKLKEPEKHKIDTSTGWAYYKTWIAPAIEPDEAILGVGANLSFEYAEECYKRFCMVVPPPEHTISRMQKGATPYRRPPYSFVTDGFVCLGDSACITKPYSGEGITAAWNLCDIAARVAGEAMKDGAFPSLNALWQINKEYMNGQGADFAYIMATLINAVDCSAEENDYEFKKGIVFNDKDMSDMNRDFAVNMSLSSTLKLAGGVTGGVLKGKIKFATVKSLLKGVGCADKLKKLYKDYPSSPEGYEAWRAKAEALWKKTGSMADIVLATEAKRKPE